MNAVQDHLKALRTAVEGCRTAVFVDLDSELVLSCSARDAPRQEQLDAIASAAVRALPAAGGPPSEALILAPGTATYFLRSSVEPGEALCCICGSDFDLPALQGAAQIALDAIGSHAGE